VSEEVSAGSEDVSAGRVSEEVSEGSEEVSARRVSEEVSAGSEEVSAGSVSEEVSAGRMSEEDAARTKGSKLQMKIPFRGWNNNIKVDIQVTWRDSAEQIQRVQNMAQ
jgi:hypothetical protein